MREREIIRSEEAKRIKYRKCQFEKYLESDFLNDEQFTDEIIRTVDRYLFDYEQSQSYNDLTDVCDYNISRSFLFQETRKKISEIFESQNIPMINSRFNARFLPNHFYSEDLRTDEEMIRDLGVLYLMFGSTYYTYFNYHTYKLRLNKKIERDGAFARVKVDVYEDNVLICDDIVIGFWPYHYGDRFVSDMEWSCYSSNTFKKYDNGCSDYLNKILKEMQTVWNSYLGDCRRVLSKIKCLAGYIEAEVNEEINLVDEVYVSKIIQEVEESIDSRNSCKSCKMCKPLNLENYVIHSYKSYSTLEDLLKKSGIVYQVRNDGVYIWEYNSDKFMKLINYSPYIKKFGGEYILYLMRT